MKRNTSLFLLAAATLLAPLCNAQTAVLTEDFSSYNSLPTALHGKRPATAPAAWSSTPSVMISSSGDNRYASVSSGRTFLSTVPINPQWLQGTVTVSGELRPHSQDADQNTWIAIGIGSAHSDTNNPRWAEGILFLVNTSGGYELHLSGEKLIPLRRGRVSNFSPAKATSLSFSYNHKDQTLSAKVDGKTILENYELVNNDFTPKPTFAGFSGFGQNAGSALVENFSITVTP